MSVLNSSKTQYTYLKWPFVCSVEEVEHKYEKPPEQIMSAGRNSASFLFLFSFTFVAISRVGKDL